MVSACAVRMSESRPFAELAAPLWLKSPCRARCDLTQIWHGVGRAAAPQTRGSPAGHAVQHAAERTRGFRGTFGDHEADAVLLARNGRRIRHVRTGEDDVAALVAGDPI